MELLTNVWPQWKVVRELGEGSFGKVFEIERQDIGGTYKAALKVITIPKTPSEVNDILSEGMDMHSATQYFHGMMEEIVKEFAMMEKLKGNTNIVTYEDHEVVNHEEGIGWDILIRMELLTTLTKHMTDYEFVEKDVIKLGIDICKALELCQQYNIIHRDIKPENIFVSELGDFKLGDFGVARTAEKTMSGMSKKGTYTYMAPEVYKGEAYNATVDLYSLGIVLYRLINDNRTPFLPPAPQMISFSDREKAQARRMDGEELPKPSKGSKELAEIILKACAFNPKERYADATQMREALEVLLREVSVSAKVATEEVQTDEDMLDKTVAMSSQMATDEDKTVAMSSQTLAEEDKTVAMSGQMSTDEDKTVCMQSYEESTKSFKNAVKDVPKQDNLSQNKTSKNIPAKKNGKKKTGIFVGLGAVVIALVLGVILLGGTEDDKEVMNTVDTNADNREQADSGNQKKENSNAKNLLPSEWSASDENKWVPAEGTEWKPNDGSVEKIFTISKQWILKDSGQYLGSESMVIGEGTENEIMLRALPDMIVINGEYDVIDGVYYGELISYGTNEQSLFDALYAMNGDTFSIGFPYDENGTEYGMLSSSWRREKLNIKEYQYKAILEDNELKLMIGSIDAVYVPNGD